MVNIIKLDNMKCGAMQKLMFYFTRFDAWAFLFGLKRKACQLGTEYVEAEVVGFKFEENDGMVVAGMDYGEPHNAVKAIIIRTPEGEIKTIHFAYCIIAAGHESTNIAYMARIGRGEGILSVPLPVEPRYVRINLCLYLYVCSCV